MKVLVLTKSRLDYAGNVIGLHNSALFLVDGLDKLGVDVKTTRVVDANGIDKEVYDYKPDLVILEALWATPAKLRLLTRLHPSVNWVVRIHSNVPFLSMEGTAIEQIKELVDIDRVLVAANNEQTATELTTSLQSRIAYLPNIYLAQEYTPQTKTSDNDSILDISCFGAIRPLKNQLIQTLAAITTANRLNKVLHFHINGTRVEQSADPILKNIRAAFKNTRHKLVEHDWLSHPEFLELVSKMDAGLQVSLTESFNIVVADHVHVGVPVVVSPEINWLPKDVQVEATNMQLISNSLVHTLRHKQQSAKANTRSLEHYNHEASKVWNSFLANL